jgi:hypothetical protein
VEVINAAQEEKMLGVCYHNKESNSSLKTKETAAELNA